MCAQESELNITGLWMEQDGGSTLEFTEEGGYTISFEPPLSDGTSKIGSESFTRVDKNHLTFTVVMGRFGLDIIEVKVSINSSNVLKFKLDDKTYHFIKSTDQPKETSDQSKS